MWVCAGVCRIENTQTHLRAGDEEKVAAGENLHVFYLIQNTVLFLLCPNHKTKPPAMHQLIGTICKHVSEEFFLSRLVQMLQQHFSTKLLLHLGSGRSQNRNSFFVFFCFLFFLFFFCDLFVWVQSSA